MITRKKLIFAGAVMALAGVIAASLIVGLHKREDRKKAEDERRATTEEIRRSDGNKKSTEESRQGNDRQKNVIVYDTGHLYYLDPEADQEFSERLSEFLKEKGIRAGSAQVLDYCIDDSESPETPAVFFLQTDDKGRSVIQVSFEKTTGSYCFNIYSGTLPEGTEPGNGGPAEYEIPESTEDMMTDDGEPVIADPEGGLEKTADMGTLKEALQQFLRSKGEGRRNFYVGSVTVTRTGYEALLYFETVRQDGRNVKVRYDGVYHFQFF